MSMWSPPISSTSSHPRGPRPLSSTWVRPRWSSTPRVRPRSKPGIELLELGARPGLDVAVEGVAVGVDPHGQRAEILDAELPEALRHEVLPLDVLDLLDLGRLERCGTADDREVDHPEGVH